MGTYKVLFRNAEKNLVCPQSCFNALGNVYQTTTYDAASGGSIVNQDEDLYNGLDQLIQEYQSHSGAVVTGTTPSVQYAYTEMSGGQNNSRLTSMTYPNGRSLGYTYATGLDSTISRLSSITSSGTTLESYKYLGLDTVVERDHPQDGINQTFISQTGSTGDAGDQYTGLDRFGRVVEQNWYKTSTSTPTDDFLYGYDQDSNVLYKKNTLHAAFSELYHANGATNGYDNLNQLTNFARGTLSDTNSDGIPDTVASPSTTESWALDALGNFTSVTLNGTQTNRTTNQQNEVTAVGSSSLTYDANGNTLTDGSGTSYTYNAWNQLVSAASGGSTIAAYSVDGLGHRVRENEGGTLTDVYFSAQWQVVEEDVSGSTTNQYVWSPVYVNAMIERDTPTQRLYVQQDANWNVTALVSVSGAAVERYLYDPYGDVTYKAGGWGSRSSSSYGWHYLFQGGRLDAASGLYSFEHRDYSPQASRWLQVDPLVYRAADTNLYRAEADDPVSIIDPSGRAGEPGQIPPRLWAQFVASFYVQYSDEEINDGIAVDKSKFGAAVKAMRAANSRLSGIQWDLSRDIAARDHTSALFAAAAYSVEGMNFDVATGSMRAVAPELEDLLVVKIVRDDFAIKDILSALAEGRTIAKGFTEAVDDYQDQIDDLMADQEAAGRARLSVRDAILDILKETRENADLIGPYLRDADGFIAFVGSL